MYVCSKDHRGVATTKEAERKGMEEVKMKEGRMEGRKERKKGERAYSRLETGEIAILVVVDIGSDVSTIHSSASRSSVSISNFTAYID